MPKGKILIMMRFLTTSVSQLNGVFYKKLKENLSNI